MKRFRNYLSIRIGSLAARAAIYRRYRLAAKLDAVSRRLWVTSVLLCLAFSARAATICTETPVLSPDSVAVCADSAGLGKQIIAIPGDTATVWFNDNAGNNHPGHNGDFDFSDASLLVTFSRAPSGLVAATVTWNGEDSALTNAAGIVGYGLVSDSAPGPVFSGLYAIDSTVVAEILTGDGRTYYTGPASVNPDCTVHGWVSETPEPATLMMLGLGLGLMSARLLWLARRAR